MSRRTVEDRLREEYFSLLPEISRVTEFLETKVRYTVLPLLSSLDEHEQIYVVSRAKACDSAVDALRRRQETRLFDQERPEAYSLKSLRDLAGVRVLAFPRVRLSEVDDLVRRDFPSWEADHVPATDRDVDPLAFKYSGTCEASGEIRGEIQVVSMLIGHFWDVEHSAIYKPAPRYKGVAQSLAMQERTEEVYRSLRAFEDEFAREIERARGLP